MKTTVEVTSKREGELVRQALADPETRVIVNVLGALLTLPNLRQRLRVMTFVSDRLAQDDDADKPAARGVIAAQAKPAPSEPLPFGKER